MTQQLTNALATYKAQQEAASEPVILDQVVFALIPGLDPSLPIDPDETLPPENQIQYRYDIPENNKGFINPDAVVYSCLLGTDIGTWNYNAIYLVNSALNLAGVIIHEPEQSKVKADPLAGIEGDTLSRNLVTTYKNAQALTQINVPAETWQLEFNTRLSTMDERVRKNNLTEYGQAAFLEDGWKVSHTAGAITATIEPGAGYVGGLKSVLTTVTPLDLTHVVFPKTVYLVATFQGQANSEWMTINTLRIEDSLAPTFIEGGVTYYAAPLAQLTSTSDAQDLRALSRTDEKLKALNSDYEQRFSDMAQSMSQMLTVMRQVEGKLGRVRIYQNTDMDNDYLPIDGATLNKADYPDYFDYLGITEDTLTLPNWSTHGYLRQFADDIDPGTQLEQEILSHNHSASTNTTGNHTHTINSTNLGTKTTSNASPDIKLLGNTTKDGLSRAGSIIRGLLGRWSGDGTEKNAVSGLVSGTTHSHSVALGSHNHSMGGSGNHSHTVTVDNTGGEENRPRSTVVVYAVKVKYLVPDSL